MATLAVACAAWTAASVSIGSAGEHVPAAAPVVAHIAAGLGAAVIAGWLAVRIRRVVMQPRWDEEAARMLDVLRLEGLEPDAVLLEVHAVQWSSRSGQRVWAVDALSGAVGDWWLPGQVCPPGSVVLLRQPPERPPEVVVCMPWAALEAANRHRAQVVHRRPSAGHMVVEEAERLLRDP